MASYVYVKSEFGPDPLWTVGFYSPDDKWEPESDHPSEDKAAARVRWLNGDSHHEPTLLAALIDVTDRLAWLNSDDDAHIMAATDRARAAIAAAKGKA